MVHDVFNAYADAIRVATTLRAPAEPLHMLANQRFAEREADRRRGRAAEKIGNCPLQRQVYDKYCTGPDPFVRCCAMGPCCRPSRSARPRFPGNRCIAFDSSLGNDLSGGSRTRPPRAPMSQLLARATLGTTLATSGSVRRTTTCQRARESPGPRMVERGGPRKESDGSAQ